jgi:hypothetical protein
VVEEHLEPLVVKGAVVAVEDFKNLKEFTLLKDKYIQFVFEAVVLEQTIIVLERPEEDNQDLHLLYLMVLLWSL